jgi:C-terminal processing protease CtpA/Prc
MAMKATGRAILIGEKTGGYGHWGGIAQLTDGFSMFIPSGRTYHPINKLGWEGIGITPDIMIDEEKSLDSAFERIRTHL